MSEIVLVQIEGIIDLEDDLVAAILAVRHLGPDRTDNEPSIFRAALSRVERYTISELKNVIHLVHCHLVAAENRRGRAIILAPIMTLQLHVQITQINNPCSVSVRIKVVIAKYAPTRANIVTTTRFQFILSACLGEI